MSELRRLRYFLAVAEERNFTRAAERLHIAQPALSRQVRELERELGVELLVRTTHKVEPTEAGRMLLERGPALLASADSLWRGVREFADGRIGSVNLGYGMSAGYDTAPQLLLAMSEEFPGIEVSARVIGYADIMQGVASGNLDVGLVRCASVADAVADGLSLSLVRQERQGLILSRQHPLARKNEDAIAVADLDGVRLLLHSRRHNPGHYDTIMGIAAAAGVRPDVQVPDPDADGAYTAVASGSSVTVVGESGRIGLPTGLVWLPLEPEAVVDVHLVTRAQNRSKAVERFLQVGVQTSLELGWVRDAI